MVLRSSLTAVSAVLTYYLSIQFSVYLCSENADLIDETLPDSEFVNLVWMPWALVTSAGKFLAALIVKRFHEHYQTNNPFIPFVLRCMTINYTWQAIRPLNKRF